jgi:hypothetical protein
MYLGMGTASPDMVTLTHNLAIGDDDAADPGIWLGGVKTTPSQFQGMRHETMVIDRK